MAEMIELLCLVLLELEWLEMDDVVGWVRSTGLLLRERRAHRLWGLAVLDGGCGQGALYLTVGLGGRRAWSSEDLCLLQLAS